MKSVDGAEDEDFAFYTDENGLRRMDPLAEHLIYVLQGLWGGIGYEFITRGNVDSVYERLCALWNANEAPLEEAKTGEAYYPTKADVERYIGLSTENDGFTPAPVAQASRDSLATVPLHT